MKFLALFLPLVLYANEYFAKIEPFESYTFASKVSGLITYTNQEILSHISKDSIIIKIDDEISKASYDISLKNYQTRKELYKSLKKVSSSSKSSKNREKLLYLGAKQAYINAKDDLKSRQIRANGLYISKIFVKKGDFVAPGSKLFKAYDISHSKITIYVDFDDIKDIKNRKFFVNGKENFTLYKFFKITDETRISSYEVQLIGPPQKEFSQIAKVKIQ